MITRLFLAFLTIAVTLLPVGCGTQSAERVSERTIAASNVAVDAAMKAFYLKYAKDEAANQATRTEDPGGYLERQNALLLKHGKVSDGLDKYQAAVRLTVAAFIAAHGEASTTVIPSTSEVDAAAASLLTLTR